MPGRFFISEKILFFGIATENAKLTIMRNITVFLFLFIMAGFAGTLRAQAPAGTLPEGQVPLRPLEASEYILRLVEKDELWRNDKDSLRISLRRLVDHYNEPFDSVEVWFGKYPFPAVEIAPGSIVKHDTLPLKWLSPSLFFVDTIALEKEPFIYRETVVMKAVDSLSLPNLRMVPELKEMMDSLINLIKGTDTIREVFIDRAYLEQKRVRLHEIENGRITPPLLPRGSRKTYRFMPDSLSILVTEATRVLIASADSPFYIVPSRDMPDSLQRAVKTLLDHTYRRDSTLVYINDNNGFTTPFWLSTGKDDLYRFWARNANRDSVTVWLGNPSRNNLTLALEDEVIIEHLEKRAADEVAIARSRPQMSLATVRPLQEIPIYWDYGLTNALSLNQNFLSNWSRGGESSLSGMMDISGRARYTHKANNVQWTNSARIRFGTIGTIEPGFKINNIRTSTDIIEVNSQFNKKLKNKFDFSSVFYFKTQLAKGFRAPNFDDPVSKFLNPGALTIGVGVEYKPNDKTQINFSPLSYRNTFVLDTANINQTLHGVDKDKRSRQEMGAQLVFRNRMDIRDDLRVTNAVRLFSSYLNKPQNIDVDWEMTLEKQISYLFSVRLNLHLIYDDDIRFPLLDAAGQPVLLPDGSERKVAKAQLNQFLGLTFSFRL